MNTLSRSHPRVLPAGVAILALTAVGLSAGAAGASATPSAPRATGVLTVEKILEVPTDVSRGDLLFTGVVRCSYSQDPTQPQAARPWAVRVEAGKRSAVSAPMRVYEGSWCQVVENPAPGVTGYSWKAPELSTRTEIRGGESKTLTSRSVALKSSVPTSATPSPTPSTWYSGGTPAGLLVVEKALNVPADAKRGDVEFRGAVVCGTQPEQRRPWSVTVKSGSRLGVSAPINVRDGSTCRVTEDPAPALAGLTWNAPKLPNAVTVRANTTDNLTIESTAVKASQSLGR